MWNISYIKRQIFLTLTKIKVWTELQQSLQQQRALSEWRWRKPAVAGRAAETSFVVATQKWQQFSSLQIFFFSNKRSRTTLAPMRMYLKNLLQVKKKDFAGSQQFAGRLDKKKKKKKSNRCWKSWQRAKSPDKIKRRNSEVETIELLNVPSSGLCRAKLCKVHSSEVMVVGALLSSRLRFNHFSFQRL